MSIGTPNAKRADSSTTRGLPWLPRSQVGIDIKRTLGKINLGIGVLKVQRRRNHSMLECQDCFDQPSNTCSSIQMTKIGFERTYGTITTRGTLVATVRHALP